MFVFLSEYDKLEVLELRMEFIHFFRCYFEEFMDSEKAFAPDHPWVENDPKNRITHFSEGLKKVGHV